MSSTTRANSRLTGESSCNGIVRRMVSLPRSIIGGFSRVMGHGIDRIGLGLRRNQNQPPPPPDLLQNPPQDLLVAEEWAFIASFEQQYGMTHPFFYACRFMEALKIAAEEHKFMFVYLHSPEHPFTPGFCRETLCSEVVVQYLDANFVCWAALADRGEGLQMTATLRPASFPFCAVVAPAAGNSLAVLQQMEGPISPAELVEILQRTVEEQGLAFGAKAKDEEKRRARAKEEEKLRTDRRLREEQNAAYFAALQIDKEKGKLKSSSPETKTKQVSNKANQEKIGQSPAQKQYGRTKTSGTSTRETQDNNPQITQILIRFPNGERREQSFLCTDKVQSIYKYIDSMEIPGIHGNYRLISNFPRTVYDVEQVNMTLKDVGLHPRASLFLEFL